MRARWWLSVIERTLRRKGAAEVRRTWSVGVRDLLKENRFGMNRVRNKTGFASPHYGKLDISSLPCAVRAIWYSKKHDLPPAEPHGWSWEQKVEIDCETPDLVRKIIDAATLTDRQALAVWMRIVEDCTLEEVALALGCTRPYAGQSVAKGLLRLQIVAKYCVLDKTDGEKIEA